MNVIDCGVAVLSMHAPWRSQANLISMKWKKEYEAIFEKTADKILKKLQENIRYSINKRSRIQSK